MIIDNLRLELIFLFIILLLISFFLHWYFFFRSKKILIRKEKTDAIRWASQTKPILGGVTFYLTFLVGTFLLFFLISDYEIILKTINIIVFISVTIAFFMGLADDLLSTSPYFKFLIQLIIAIFFIYFGMEIQFFKNEFLNYLLTIFWVVGIMNSFNMLDNMDAVTTVISISILLILSVFLFINASPYIIISIIILPSLLSFLLFNWHPAKMYMGDNGSQFLGAIFAGIGIFFFWQHGAVPVNYVFSQLQTVLIVSLVFLIPIVDTSTVTINRILAGKSPFKGGKDHTTHFLIYRGLSEKQVIILLGLISIVSNLLAMFFLFRIITFTFIKELGVIIFIFFVFLVLYGNTLVTKPK